MKKLVSLMLAMAMVLALALTGCGGSNGGNEAPKESAPAASTPAENAPAESAPAEAPATTGSAPDVLDVGTTEQLGYLLPYSSSECGAGLFLVYDMLFYYDANDELASNIITDYSFEEDGFALRLTMRDDIVFSNGDPATGEDLLFSLSSIKDEARGAVTSSFNYFDFENSYVDEDGYTVVLKTYDTATCVSQFGNLTLVCLLDKAWCEEVGWSSQDWYTGPVGSGPYAVTDYLTDHSYQFTLRDDYWGSTDNLPRVINFTSYEEASTMYMDLENGEIAVAIEPDSLDLERAAADDSDNMDYRFINGNTCNWMVLDCEGLFSDINLRKAVAHAVRWDDVATAGKGIKFNSATSSIPSDFPDYKYEGQYEYDPDYARECLAEAGYSVDNPLTVVMYVGPQPGTIASATVMQAQLAEVGIDLQFESYEMATVVPMWIAGEGDISSFAMQGGSLGKDAAWCFKELGSNATMGDNRTFFDSTIDDLMAKALVASSQEEAREYYYEIQDWIYDNYRVISYFEEVNGVCFDTDVVTEIHLGNRQYPDLRFLTYAE